MGDELAAWRGNIGRYGLRFSNKKMKGKIGDSKEMDDVIKGILYTIMIIITLVIGGIEVNPGPRNEIDEFKEMMIAMKEDLSKGIDNVRQEVGNIGTQLGILNGKYEEVKNENDFIKKENSVLKNLEFEERKRSMKIFGLERGTWETREDLFYKVCEFLSNFTEMNINEVHIVNAYRVGKGKAGPIKISFVSVIIKERVMSRARNLKGTNYRIEHDYDAQTRLRRKQLLPFLISARKRGEYAILINDKIKIENRILELEFCLRNEINKGKSEGERRQKPSQAHIGAGTLGRDQDQGSRYDNRDTRDHRSNQVETSEKNLWKIGNGKNTREGCAGNEERSDIVDIVSSQGGSLIAVSQSAGPSHQGGNQYNLRNWCMQDSTKKHGKQNRPK